MDEIRSLLGQRILSGGRRFRPVVKLFETTKGVCMNDKTFITRAERRSVSLRGFALGPSRDSDIAVSDLSYGGCQIQSGDEFSEGEVVELRIIKRGAAAAEIRWTADGRAGVRFLN